MKPKGLGGPWFRQIRFIKFLCFVPLAILFGCSTKPVFVPVASVHYDGFSEAKEIIATLKAHGIPVHPASEADIVFPILVPKSDFQTAVSILQTNALVASEKVRLYTTIRWEEK